MSERDKQEQGHQKRQRWPNVPENSEWVLFLSHYSFNLPPFLPPPRSYWDNRTDPTLQPSSKSPNTRPNPILAPPNPILLGCPLVCSPPLLQQVSINSTLFNHSSAPGGLWLTAERQQNMPSQNMPPWHKDSFELIIFKKQQTQEKLWEWSTSYLFVRNIYIYKKNPGFLVPL